MVVVVCQDVRAVACQLYCCKLLCGCAKHVLARATCLHMPQPHVCCHQRICTGGAGMPRTCMSAAPLVALGSSLL